MSQAIQLHQGTDLKLRDFQANDLAKVTTQLIGLSSLMGLRELSALEAVAISDFIQEEFKDFTFQEIQYAFKMNIAGRLLTEKGEKTEPYGSLNINYVGTVLSLYRKHRTLELKRINKAAPLPMKTEEQKQAEIKLVMEEIFKELNEKFKAKEFKFTYSPGIKYFGCLDYYGMIPSYSDNISRDLWEKAKEMQINRLMTTNDRESRLLRSLIKTPSLTVSDDIREKAKIQVTGNYKGLIASKCLIDFSEMFDDLNDCRF